MSFKYRLVALTVCAALSACNTAQTHIGDEDHGFGEAVKYDAAIQTINPTPIYSADAAKPGSNGDVGAAAVKRYRTGKVKSVQSLQTTSGNGGGSGGMSSGNGPQ